MFKGIRQILVIACGTCTSVIAALLLALSVVKLRIAIHYFTLWGVFPLGAILSGFVAASGYRFGARILRQPPGRLLLAAVMATSAGTVFLTCYIPYALIVGNSLSNAVGFGTFLNLAIHAQSVNFMGLGATGPLGRLGYVFFSLQVLGFALGGGLLYGTLSTRAYCKTCRRYHVPQLSIVRYCPSEYEAATAFLQTGTLLSHGHGFLACQLTSSLSEVEGAGPVQSTSF